MLCFFHGFVIANFTHILQDYFISTGKTKSLPPHERNNRVKYGWINHMDTCTDWGLKMQQKCPAYILHYGLWYHWKEHMIHMTWWRHQMETFSTLLAHVTGSHWSLVNSPHKGQWYAALMFSLICTWINSYHCNGAAPKIFRSGNITKASHYEGISIVFVIKFILRQAVIFVLLASLHSVPFDIQDSRFVLNIAPRWKFSLKR